VPLRSRHGESLVELIVALVLLELAGTFALAAAFSAERAGRRVAHGANEDRLRWEQYRTAEIAPACVGAGTPSATVLVFPATPERPAFAATVRCGP
jgi:hypothetical protein